MTLSYLTQIGAGFFLSQSAFAETPKVITKTTLGVNAAYVAKWNETSRKLEKSESLSEKEKANKAFGVHFNPNFEEQDKRYFSQLNISNLKLPELKIAGSSYEFLNPTDSSVLFKAQVLGDNKYTFNGKAFEYNLNESLEANMKRIRQLLNPTTESSFFDALFFPQAQALDTVWAVLIGLAVGYLTTTTIISKGNNFKQFFNHSGKSLSEGGHAVKGLVNPNAEAPAE